MMTMESIVKGNLVSGKVVCLIKLPKWLSFNRRPHLLDYKNPVIKEIIPCIQHEKNFLDIVQGKKVLIDDDTLIWPVSVGTVFNYPDGRKILLSRTIKSRELLLIDGSSFTFNPMSMVCYNVK